MKIFNAKSASLLVILALSACTHSPAIEKLHAPIKSFHAAEVPFSIETCQSHLFEGTDTIAKLRSHGYENKPYPMGPYGYEYSKSVTNLTLQAYAAIGLEDQKSCKIQIYSNAGGGPIEFLLKQKLLIMGYRTIGNENYGAFGILTRTILTNGTNTIAFTGRKRTQNATSTVFISLSKRLM